MSRSRGLTRGHRACSLAAHARGIVARVERPKRRATYEDLMEVPDDESVRAEPFDAVELHLGRWWMPRSAAAT